MSQTIVQGVQPTEQIRIPDKNSRFLQTNESDIFGNLFSTFNCDFTNNVGALRLGKRLIVNTNTTDVSTMTSFPAAFKVFARGGGAVTAYTIAGSTANPGYVFQGGADPTVPFTQMAGSPTGIDSGFSDLEIFNNELHVTPDGSNSYYYDGSTWTALGTGSSANGFPRPLCAPNFLARLYTSINGYTVVSTDSSHNYGTGAFTITLDSAVYRTVITFIKSSSNRIWIGTISLQGGRGTVVEWDGTSATPINTYLLPSSGAISCVIKNDVPYVMDSNGSLFAWSGGAFVRESGFNRLNNKVLYNSSSVKNNRFVHPNGMALIQGNIHILAHLANNDGTNDTTGNNINGTQEVCNPSGVWEYDSTLKELKHKYSVSLGHTTDQVNDHGQLRLYGVGAIAEFLQNKDSPFNTNNGQFVTGSTYYTDTNTKLSAVHYDDTNDTIAKAGSIVTSKFYTGNLKSSWHRAFVNHLAFLNRSTDKMILKYRLIVDSPTEAVITWLTNTSLTSTADLSAYVTGDEIEVIEGTGAGHCAHITTVVGSTINIDETVPGVSGTSKIRLQKWKKAGVINDAVDFDSVSLTGQSSWIQFKIWFAWTGQNEFNSAIVTYTPSQEYI